MEAQKKLTANLNKNRNTEERNKSEEDDEEDEEEIGQIFGKERSTTIIEETTTIVVNKTTSSDDIKSGTITSASRPIKSNDKKPQMLSEQISSERQSMASSDYQGSSESERESETETTRIKRHHPRNLGSVVDDHESTGLVSQESFDEELPYIPTTLPEERAVGIALIPVKERAYMELKMCPVERPRSTTPINPASLEEYCGTMMCEEFDNLSNRAEKLKISLPRRDSKDRGQKSKSPRRISNASNKTWFEFAEQGLKGDSGGSSTTSGGGGGRRSSNQDQDDDPPPLPPRKPNTYQWINFEDIPERKRLPKKITTIPMKEPPPPPLSTLPDPVQQYNYVNPDECQCECHESERSDGSRVSESQIEEVEIPPPEDTQPLLEPDVTEGIDRTSISDSSMDFSLGADHETLVQQQQPHLDVDVVPFGMDLSVQGLPGSNRSSVVSQVGVDNEDFLIY